MAYDDGLVERVRNALEGRDGIAERKMFGSLAFMLDGNMAVAVGEDGLIVRLGEEDAETAMKQPGVEAFPPNHSPMRGWVLVSAEQIAEDDDLAGWIDDGTAFAATLPPK